MLYCYFVPSVFIKFCNELPSVTDCLSIPRVIFFNLTPTKIALKYTFINVYVKYSHNTPGSGPYHFTWLS